MRGRGWLVGFPLLLRTRQTLASETRSVCVCSLKVIAWVSCVCRFAVVSGEGQIRFALGRDVWDTDARGDYADTYMAGLEIG